LQDITGFQNPDFHGLLSMCRPKFLHQDTERISEKSSGLDIYSSILIFVNLADFTSLQEITTLRHL